MKNKVFLEKREPGPEGTGMFVNGVEVPARMITVPISLAEISLMPPEVQKEFLSYLPDPETVDVPIYALSPEAKKALLGVHGFKMAQ